MTGKSWFVMSIVCVGLGFIVFSLFRSHQEEGIPGWTKLNTEVEHMLGGQAENGDTAERKATGGGQSQRVKEAGSAQMLETSTSSVPADQPSMNGEAAAASSPETAKDKTDNTVGADTSKKKININEASAEQLMELPGIGGAKAKAIVQYRETHGKFKSVSDLTKVKGIGPKILAKMREQIAL